MRCHSCGWSGLQCSLIRAGEATHWLQTRQWCLSLLQISSSSSTPGHFGQDQPGGLRGRKRDCLESVRPEEASGLQSLSVVLKTLTGEMFNMMLHHLPLRKRSVAESTFGHAIHTTAPGTERRAFLHLMSQPSMRLKTLSSIKDTLTKVALERSGRRRGRGFRGACQSRMSGAWMAAVYGCCAPYICSLVCSERHRCSNKVPGSVSPFRHQRSRLGG